VREVLLLSGLLRLDQLLDIEQYFGWTLFIDISVTSERVIFRGKFDIVNF
jgi:hypothetical protein